MIQLPFGYVFCVHNLSVLPVFAVYFASLCCLELPMFLLSRKDGYLRPMGSIRFVGLRSLFRRHTDRERDMSDD